MDKVTIISDNCISNYLYDYCGLKYNSPTMSLFINPPCFIKFCGNLKHYLNLEMEFAEGTKYDLSDIRSHWNYPIGRLDDVEIHFLHRNTEREAKEKWNRRRDRVNFDNLIIFGHDMKGCTAIDKVLFNQLPYENKFLFSSKDSNLPSVVFLEEFSTWKEVGHIYDYPEVYKKHFNFDNFFKSKL